MKNPNDPSLQPCPVCGFRTLKAVGKFETCELCGWKDDPAQSADPDLKGGANAPSLNEAQAAWQGREKRRAASLKKTSPPPKARTVRKPGATGNG